MSLKIALVGAGGKMGCRLTDNFLKFPTYDVSYLEVSEPCIEKLRFRGVSVTTQEQAIPGADVVILAVPDVAIGKISQEIIPQMRTRPKAAIPGTSSGRSPGRP